MAAIRAHLRVSARDRIFERALGLDESMLVRMREVAAAHPSVSRIDGRGLHWTIELHGPDWRTWRGEEAEPLASRVAARALDADALIATSGEQTSLFIAPPLIVTEEELNTIFEPFKRGHSGKVGSGLGLAIARRAVEAHGKTIHAESSGDSGCHFWFELPKASH